MRVVRHSNQVNRHIIVFISIRTFKIQEVHVRTTHDTCSKVSFSSGMVTCFGKGLSPRRASAARADVDAMRGTESGLLERENEADL